MKKLLHERLHEWAKDKYPLLAAFEDFNVCGNKQLYNAIAAEIERYYIPIPLDKDGKQIDRSKIYFGADGRCWTIKGFCNAKYEVFGESDEVYKPLRAEWLSTTNPRQSYDSDGVPFKPYEKVWRVGDLDPNRPHNVIELISKNKIRVASSGGLNGVFNVCYFTHREPDSLKKLRDGLHKDYLGSDEFNPPSGITERDVAAILDDISDRLTAFIERDA